MTTIGQLISNLYTKYEREYQDGDLAAVATQVSLIDILHAGRRTARLAASGRKAA